MYLHRMYIFFTAALCIINVCNTQLFSAEHPLFYYDTSQHIFAEGTESSNQALSCTCKEVNKLGTQYRQKKVEEFNNTFRGVEFIILPKIDRDHYFLIPSAILMPGSKHYSIIRYNDSSHSGERCILSMQDFSEYRFAKTTIEHGILSNLERKYCISAPSIALGTKTPEKTYLSLIVASKQYDLYEITNTTNHILKNNSFVMTEYPDSPTDSFIKFYDITFTFDENRLDAVTHTKLCPLADTIICYDALSSMPAYTEYEFDHHTDMLAEKMRIPEISLAITKKTHADHYRLKKDSLLQDKRVQQHLYTLIGVIDKTNDKTLANYSVEDLRGFYVTSNLLIGDKMWPKNIAILALLCNKEIQAQRSWLTLLAHKLNLLSPKNLLQNSTIEKWHGKLSDLLKSMKHGGERSYDVYLDTVKTFLTSDYSGWKKYI